MSKARKPTAILELSGAFKKNPARAAARAGDPLPIGEIGDPPANFDQVLAQIWRDLVAECAPGVAKRSDRMALEGFCRVSLRCRNPKARASDFALLRAYAQQFGMTPAGRSLVCVAPDDNGNEFSRAAAELEAARLRAASRH